MGIIPTIYLMKQTNSVDFINQNIYISNYSLHKTIFIGAFCFSHNNNIVKQIIAYAPI